MARLEDELERLRALIDAGRLTDGQGLLGVELEFHLIDDAGRPAPCNDAVLAALADGPHDVQRELARFNLELNLPPLPLTGTPLTSVRTRIDALQEAVAGLEPATVALSIGTLPTLTLGDADTAAISGHDRYRELDASIMSARGAPIELTVDGTGAGGERLAVTLHSITLEAAATSLQIHLDLPADGFVAAWNAAQAAAALQVAVAGNSPILLGRALWHETRIPLFEQVIDVRRPVRTAGAMGGPPPRVWFGQRWIDHPVDLFAENVVHFGHLLTDPPEDADEDAFSALRLHNGTIWRWNRPVYDVIGGRPTLRMENRVLSAPPTSRDGSADIALFLGLVAGLRDDVEALTSALPFPVAETNFRDAARYGLEAGLCWPGAPDGTPAAHLLRTRLLDVAAAGLAALGVPTAESDPALDIIAARAASGRTGATWQLAALADEEQRHDRVEALRRVVLRYRDLQQEGEPVHRWPWPGRSEPSVRSGVTPA
jgi:gamma-glutamyl:cysteine ligase YbdK (ATP-grasp superfamily)